MVDYILPSVYCPDVVVTISSPGEKRDGDDDEIIVDGRSDISNCA
jgi:hypothetical protein